MDALDLSALFGLLSQGTRLLGIDTVLPGAFLVEQVHGRESVNGECQFVVSCLSASAFLDLDPLPGSLASLRIATADGGTRSWRGYITHALSLGSDGGLARYRLVIESSLAFLRLRRNSLISTNKHALDVIGSVFADHPEVRWRSEVSATLRARPICTQYRELDADYVQRLLGEEGLSYRFEHDQSGGDNEQAPSHTLVIFDTQASLPEGDPAALRFHRIDATEQDDAITVFSERRQIVPDSAMVSSWKVDELIGVAGSTQAAASDGPSLPGLDLFEANRAGFHDTAEQAQRRAENLLDARRLEARTFHGQGSVRTLEAGKIYTLTGHPDLDGTAFVPLAVEHYATNNLGSDLAHLLKRTELEAGTYRNTFHAVPQGTPLVPAHRNRPLAPGMQTAIVVGTPESVLTSTRDHQVRVQFPWQRGVALLPGGLTDTASKAHPDGHAPGDDRSGTWVRVAEGNAGPNFGHSFVPRVGTEVLIGYISGDIDQPTVIGQLYNGQATPPFAAGVDSDANHPGTLSGIQTQTVDGQPASRWVLDDAPGQLRHELSTTLANSRLSLGYLIDQQGASRGSYRGEGFELASQGWGVLRAGEGLLLSGSARGDAVSTQMDVAGASGQLKAAIDTAKRLDQAATQAKANGLGANQAQADLHRAIDPQQDGTYAGSVNGQSATKPQGDQRSGGDPVERFAVPAIVLEGPSAIALTTPNSAAAFASEHLHLTSQHDTHVAAGATVAAVAGDAVSLTAVQGGLKAIANHGPVSIEAHADAMAILADQSVTVTSTTDRIDILAKDKIVLQSGQSTITLEGGNITFACPGNFIVKAGQHPFLGGESNAAELPVLPTGNTEGPPNWIQISHRDPDEQPFAGQGYKIFFAGGSVAAGKLDAQGQARHENVPQQADHVEYEPVQPLQDKPWDPLKQLVAAASTGLG